MKTMSFTDDKGRLLFKKPSIIGPVVAHNRSRWEDRGFTVSYTLEGVVYGSRRFDTFMEANDYRRKLIEWAEQVA